MSEELSDYVGQHVGTSRRKFLLGLLAGSAFAAPVVASFNMGGSSPLALGDSPGQLAANTDGSNCDDIIKIALAQGSSNTNGSNCESPSSR